MLRIEKYSLCRQNLTKSFLIIVMTTDLDDIEAEEGDPIRFC